MLLGNYEYPTPLPPPSQRNEKLTKLSWYVVAHHCRRTWTYLYNKKQKICIDLFCMNWIHGNKINKGITGKYKYGK